MKVAISGGGIAGLAAGAVLAERGHAVRVFERLSGEAAMGAGVVCFPNATLAMRNFGLEERLREVAGTPLVMRRISSAGQCLGDLPISIINQLVGAPSYSVLRAELHRLLSEYATERGARVEVGCEVKSVTDEEQLLLSDGRRVEADWVFGADGRMGSPLRRYVLGENQPRYGGFVNWIGVARAEEDVFDPSVVFDLWGCGQRFGVVPIDGQTAYFAGGALGPLGVASAGPLLPLLKERFAHWPEPVARALAAAEPESLREIYVHDHDPIDVWHKGRVLLLGDAAHAPLPTSGQGACQAIEDAFHVARLLDEGTSLEPEEFFQRFTECRRDKANAIIAAGRGFAKMVFSRDPEFVAKRNQQSRGTDFSETAASMAGLWSRGLPLAW